MPVSKLPTRLAFIGCILAFACGSAHAADKSLTGRQIYRKLCANCHGGNGQGVPKVNETPLTGNKSLAELVKVINDTMPEKDPKQCTGIDAKRVARYIYNAFYSPQARAKGGPARIELARLTVPQYLNSVADLFAEGRGPVQVNKRGGLNAQYFKTRRFRGNERVVQRVDANVDFQYKEKAPVSQIKDAKEFSIRWQGSIVVEETGEYEFAIKTELGARLWVNDQRKPLIDQWVASKGRAQTHTATLRLLGGRAYPIRLDVFKYKDPTGSISLLWKPPHKAMTVIPARHLAPQGMRSTFIVSTPFPPDDRVSGYDRGVTISKEWDAATTQAAIETANYVVTRLDAFTGGNRRYRGRRRFRGGNNRNLADRKEQAKRMCRKLAERAFRRPLSNTQNRFFVDAHFGQNVALQSAVKRSVLLILKSPRFLYPGVSSSKFDDYDAATKLALGLWDSVPDDQLLQAAAKGELKTPEQIEKQATRMLADSRAKAKLRHVFHDWLMIDEKEGITKDKKLFPDFDASLATDLRTSLDLFVDDVVWSENSDYRKLLTADYLYANERLAKFYGLKDVAGEKFTKVQLKDGNRAGVLTHPYLLSLFAYHNLSSPIHRGVFLTRRILGRTLKPPPQATEFKDGDFAAHMTTREKVTILTKPAACMSCHNIINPLGFSLEQFDAVGRFRTKEKNRTIDVKASLETVTGKTVQLNGPESLAKLVVSSRQAHGAFVDHLFHQTVKQPINAYGEKTRDELITRFRQQKFNIRKLLVEIMKVSISYERIRGTTASN